VLKPDIAALDTTIYLQSFTTSADAYGGLPKTWTTYATEKARLKWAATGSGEEYDKHVNLGVTRIEFTIRWRSGVSLKHRVLYDSDYYDIRKVEELGRRKFITITAEKKV
jgi:phage head-tail adaptor, putative, SPP1 family